MHGSICQHKVIFVKNESSLQPSLIFYLGLMEVMNAACFKQWDISVTVVLWTSSHILYGLPLHQKGDISKGTC